MTFADYTYTRYTIFNVQELNMSLIDKPAPGFDLEGSDGKRHRLEDYAGKRLLLFFYPKDNTSG